MQAKIDTLRVKDENDSEYLLYPKTLTKCVTDEDGNTLANMLTDMQAQIEANGGGSGGKAYSEVRSSRLSCKPPLSAFEEV